MEILLSLSSSDPQMCFLNLICANSTFISIYGVIFTIVISLGVYIYGLENETEKIVLIKNTNIQRVITASIVFFCITFISFPSPYYESLNFVLLILILLIISSAFREVFRFHQNERSKEKIVKNFKEEVIRKKLKEFDDIKLRNKDFNDFLEANKTRIERFIFDEENSAYDFIRSKRSGYITSIDTNSLFSEKVFSTMEKLPKEISFFIPYEIAVGSLINADSIILGVKGKGKISEEEKDMLRSYISLSNDYENPTSYFKAEMESYYDRLFHLIKAQNVMGLERILEDFSTFVDIFVQKENYNDVLQSINDDIVYPLQRFAFKCKDNDVIRKITAFPLRYIYESIDKGRLEIFNIFLRNLSTAFYEGLKLNVDQADFFDTYFRRIKEIAHYSLKPRLLKDKKYIDFIISLLSVFNESLKMAFDSQDEVLFTQVLESVNTSFIRDDYEHDDKPNLDEAILYKKALLFGFTAWVYKSYSNRSIEAHYSNMLHQLLNSLSRDSHRFYGNEQDLLNYYLSLYLQTTKLIEGGRSFGWDMWGMPEGHVYTVTVREDVRNLLLDRILDLLIKNPALEIKIDDKNYNDELANMKKGGVFDILKSKTKDSFYSTQSLSETQFNDLKEKVYAIFSAISEKYDKDIEESIIEQPLDDAKFMEFAEGNIKSYENARTLYRVGVFLKDVTSRKDGFGYNTLLNKDQFVSKTNVHYTNDDQFGEDLARSEDNKILEEIYKNNPEVVLPKNKTNTLESIILNKNPKAIIFWISSYIDIDNYGFKNFIPYWKEADSRKDNGAYYQGTLNGAPIYIIYKFDDQKMYPDSCFIFEDNSFTIKEFPVEQDVLSPGNVHLRNNDDLCLSISISNLSKLEEERLKIVGKWIENGSTKEEERSSKIEELKTRVIFKFFKGLSLEELVVDEKKLSIIHLS